VIRINYLLSAVLYLPDKCKKLEKKDLFILFMSVFIK